MTVATPQDVLTFWREAGPEKWWKKDPAFDQQIRDTFSATHADAVAGRLAAWAETAEGALALVIVLDQFPRNMFRDDAAAYSGDAMALAVAKAAIDEQFDHEIEPSLRAFFYLPFMHSEELADQDRCIELFAHLEGAEENRQYAQIHRDVIAKFGRFPHRNAVLGRIMSPAEQQFLDEGGFAG